MASILDTIAGEIHKGFRGKLLPGILTRAALSGSKDTYGDAVVGAPLEYTCEGFVDSYSDFIKARDGIPETDVQVNILGKSLPVDIRPRKDDKVSFTAPAMPEFNGKIYQLRGADTDPAQALWQSRAFVAGGS